MDEENISLATKAYMRRLVAQTNEYPSLYKYCSFDGGAKRRTNHQWPTRLRSRHL